MTAAPHVCRTVLETAVCEDMRRQGLPHEHRSLRFRVAGVDGANTAKYSPAIVARRGSFLFLVEPIASARARMTIEQLAGFLEQHSPEIVLVVIAPDTVVLDLPHAAYDEIYPKSDIPRMTRRIREQDPGGIVMPFVKPVRRETTR